MLKSGKKKLISLSALLTFMSSGQVSAHILARYDAIICWRKLMGPTKVLKTVHEEPESIRGTFGSTDTRNATHGSDSPNVPRIDSGSS
jgi:nucleoside-diphosphate kinase